jgi:hypothetical protein
MNRCPILKKYRVMTVWKLKYNWTYMQQNTSKEVYDKYNVQMEFMKQTAFN